MEEPDKNLRDGCKPQMVILKKGSLRWHLFYDFSGVRAS